MQPLYLENRLEVFDARTDWSVGLTRISLLDVLGVEEMIRLMNDLKLEDKALKPVESMLSLLDNDDLINSTMRRHNLAPSPRRSKGGGGFGAGGGGDEDGNDDSSQDETAKITGLVCKLQPEDVDVRRNVLFESNLLSRKKASVHGGLFGSMMVVKQTSVNTSRRRHIANVKRQVQTTIKDDLIAKEKAQQEAEKKRLEDLAKQEADEKARAAAEAARLEQERLDALKRQQVQCIVSVTD